MKRSLLTAVLILYCVFLIAQTRTFSTPGTYNFTVPAGVTSVTVKVWGGGGGGGHSDDGNSGLSSGGGGGGGGGFRTGTFTVSGGQTITIVVGAGGAGANDDGEAGEAGDNSSATHSSITITANGGAGGGAGVNETTPGTGGNGGGGSGGTGGFTGGKGANGGFSTGGKGGGGAGDANNGGDGTGRTTGGAGGAASGGTGGDGGNSSNDGVNGADYGGGGGGTGDDASTNDIGGNGGDGAIILSWTCAGVNVTNFSTVATNACLDGTSTVTVTSTSLADGTYTVYYNLTGANIATAQSASMTFSGVTGTFSTITLPNSGATTVTITSVGCADTESGNTDGFTVLSAVNYGTIASADESFCFGTTDDPSSISFSTAPSGSTSFAYQWYYQDGIVDCPTGTSTAGWTSISGATGSSYNPPSGLANSRTYACFVTPGGTPTCGVGTWANSCRKVTELPALDYGTLSSGDETICNGGDPASITFSTAPTGSGSFTYQWYYQEGIVSCPTPGSGIGSWISLGMSGQSMTYDPPSGLTGSRTYAVRVSPGGTPDCGGIDWANGCRKVTVNAFTFPQVSAFSGNTLCNGASGGQLTVTATGTGPFTVVYNDGTADRTATSVVSGTPFSPFTNPSATTTYTLVSITTSNGCTRTSGFTDGTAGITVQSAVTAGAIGNSQSQVACSSFNPIAFTNVTSGTGSDPTVTYRWESSTNLNTWTTIGGATSSTYDPPSITQTTYYRRITISTVNGVACESVPTTPVSATIGNVSVSVPSGGTITCPNPSPLAISATIVGASNPTYQWQRSSDGGANWVDITTANQDAMTDAPATYSGFTTSSLTITTANSAISGYRYRLKMTNGATCIGTYVSGSFLLTVNVCPTPIELFSFIGKQVGNAIELKWETASEKNNAYMIVEHSQDGIHFLSLQPYVKGHGTTSTPQYYTWTDRQPLNGVNYYRLKQVDYDGKVEYHRVIAVEFNGKVSNEGIRVYPTEVKDHLTVVLQAPTTKASTLNVIDLSGRILQQVRLGLGAEQHDLNTTDLPTGHYLVVLQSEQERFIARFIKF